jgi:hypothetical protein
MIDISLVVNCSIKCFHLTVHRFKLATTSLALLLLEVANVSELLQNVLHARTLHYAPQRFNLKLSDCISSLSPRDRLDKFITLIE